MIEVNEDIFLAGDADEEQEEGIDDEHHDGEDQHVDDFDVDAQEYEVQGEEEADWCNEQNASDEFRVI